MGISIMNSWASAIWLPELLPPVGIGFPIEDIAFDGIGKRKVSCMIIPCFRTQPSKIPIFDIYTVYQNFSLRAIVKPQNKVYDGSLSRAGSPIMATVLPAGTWKSDLSGPAAACSGRKHF